MPRRAPAVVRPARHQVADVDGQRVGQRGGDRRPGARARVLHLSDNPVKAKRISRFLDQRVRFLSLFLIIITEQATKLFISAPCCDSSTPQCAGALPHETEPLKSDSSVRRARHGVRHNEDGPKVLDGLDISQRER